MPAIKVQQWPTPLQAKRGSILDTALAAGVPYPHSCRSGDCGACKSRLVCGDVLMDGCAPEALSADERAAGLILACRARPRSDVEVAWLQADSVQRSYPVRRLQATVVQIEPATHDITRLRLEVREGALQFAAGQYAQLTFGDVPARAYSMANRPDDPTLEFHVRRVPGGTASGYAATQLRPGQRVRLEGPYGTAFAREPFDKPMLLVAGGSGLAPMKSILLQALANNAKGPIHLYHGVREARDLYDVEFLAGLRAGGLFTYTPVLSSAVHDARYRSGFVHQAVADDFDALSGFDVYTAGPPPMVEAVTAVAAQLGARREDVRADAFFSAPQRAQVMRNPFRVVADLFRTGQAA